MTIQAETKREYALFDALQDASAEQLRRAMKRQLVAASGANEFDEFIEPDGDTVVEDRDALDEARVRWNRGDKREALHHLELALGRDFVGLGDLRPEDVR